MNLRWSWDPPTRQLFSSIDPDAWAASGFDPIKLLAIVEKERFDSLAEDASFLERMNRVRADLDDFCGRAAWYQSKPEARLRSIAYFSPEFGISGAIPQYSGGLGVLAGDHMKAASSVGVPMIGIGLFYLEGYFRQSLSSDGWQMERNAPLDPHTMALSIAHEEPLEMDLGGRPLYARIWSADLGRVRLYLMDPAIEENDSDLRFIADRLYRSDEEHRLRQEILLGMGGVKALLKLGIEPQIFHANEGHAAFLLLSRTRHYLESGLSLEESFDAVRAESVFTTHTPVPAGMDRFSRDLMERYFKPWTDEVGIQFETLMELGRDPGSGMDAPFNMAILAMRLSGARNGVSALHGAVSRRMFQNLWPGVPEDEIPVRHVTNGVHAHTWVSTEIRELLDAHVSPQWAQPETPDWSGVLNIPDRELWKTREVCRARLIVGARRRIREGFLRRGAPENDLAWVEEAFDTNVLTIGFARRFAAYKRPALLLADEERLRALLLSKDRPIQFIFAGKSHPADDGGKDLIRQIFGFTLDETVRHRIAFLEDYDIGLARLLTQGVDLWLNNPIRPMEACGTSGQKAAMNGVLNCSTLDGWWDEMWDGQNGWAVPSAESFNDDWTRDRIEAASLFQILEKEIVPLFYERGRDGVPHGWIARVKHSLITLGPRVTATRMLRDYVEDVYEPTLTRKERLHADNRRPLAEFTQWKQKMASEWDTVRIHSVVSDSSGADVGARQLVRGGVSLGNLTTEDVEVQLLHGRVGPNEELIDAKIVPMAEKDGQFEAVFLSERPGKYGFTVRVIPSHPLASSFADLGLIRWA